MGGDVKSTFSSVDIKLLYRDGIQYGIMEADPVLDLGSNNYKGDGESLRSVDCN
jgi:hypothetical protein